MENRDALVSLLLKVNDLAVLGRELDVDNVNDLADFMDINGVCAVVRCKECQERCPNSDFSVQHCTLSGIQTEDDDFCSYGVRKGEKHG